MLNPKSKRNSSSGRNSRFAEDDAPREDSIWSGLHSISPPLGDAVPDAPKVRILRTTDPKPTAPKLQDFFPRESRPIDRVLTFWDPSSTWPQNALSDLCGEGVGAKGSTRLAQADSDQTFALIHHTAIESAEGLLYAVLHVEASPLDAASADVALMLLERSDHAVVLTGGSAEHRELPRKMQEFCRQAAWRGPTLQFISPQDKPSRADRLRKITWPRSLRVQVVEMLTDTTPGWLTRMLDRLLDDVEFPGLVRPAASQGSAAQSMPAALSIDPVDQLPLPGPWSDEARAALPPRPAQASARATVSVAELASGCLGVALLDVPSQALLAHGGDAALLKVGVEGALRRLGSASNMADETDPAEALAWHSPTVQYLSMAVPKQTGLYLLGVFDRAACELAQARWQFTVALNELA